MPAPYRPGIVAPADYTILDYTEGLLFQLEFHESQAGDKAQSYQFRRRTTVAGAAYEYLQVANGSTWGAAEATLTVGERSPVYPDGSTGQGVLIRPDKAAWANGTTYAWSVRFYGATSAAWSPWTYDYIITGRARPVVTVSAPAGLVENTNAPTVVFSVTTAAELAYADVRVFSQESYELSAFDPDSSAPVFAKRVTTAAPVAAGPLPNNPNYRVYVRAVDTSPFGSLWAFSAFGVQIEPLATPEVAGEYEPDAGRTVVIVRGRQNLLSADGASHEGAALAWQSRSNATVAHTTDRAEHGNKALRLTATADGPVSVQTSELIPIDPGQVLTVMTSAAHDGNDRDVTIWVEGRDSEGNLVPNPATPSGLWPVAVFHEDSEGGDGGEERPVTDPQPQLLVSTSADRSNAAAFTGQSFTGELFGFVILANGEQTDVPQITGVEFTIVDSLGAVVHTHSESFAPWDLVGGSDTAATPLDLTTLGGTGPYTVTAQVSYTSGTPDLLGGTFTVASTPVVTGAVRYNIGGLSFTDSSGNAWTGDPTVVVGGQVYSETRTTAPWSDLPQELRSAQYGMTELRFPWTASTRVLARVGMVEYTFSAAGRRVFDIRTPLGVVVNDLDLFAAAGTGTPVYRDIVMDVTSGVARFPVTASADNAIVSSVVLSDGTGLPLTPVVDEPIPKAPVSGLTASPLEDAVTLSWVNPTSSGFTNVVIRRALGTTPPASVSSGTGVATVTGTSHQDVGLTAGSTYSYSLFAGYADGTYATGTSITTTTLPGSGGGGTGPVDTSVPEVTVSSVDQLFDVSGVNVHLGYTSTGYDRDGIVADILDLGLAWFRDGLYVGKGVNHRTYRRHRALVDGGLKAALIAGQPSGEYGAPKAGQWAADGLRTLLDSAHYDGKVHALMGPNEPGAGTETAVKNYMREIAAALEASSNPQAKLWRDELWSPSWHILSRVQNYGLDPVATEGDAHSYPGGVSPVAASGDAGRFHHNTDEYAKRMVPGRMGVRTETGYHVAWKGDGRGHTPTTPDGYRVYAVRMLYDYALEGVKHLFFYQFQNHYAESALVDREGHFGLMSFNGEKLPAYRALKRQVDRLKQKAGTGTVPTRVRYQVSNAPARVRWLANAHPGGAIELGVWQRADVMRWHSPGNVSTINVGTDSMTVRFGSKVRLESFRPSALSESVTVLGTFNPGASIPISVSGGEVTMFRAVPVA